MTNECKHQNERHTIMYWIEDGDPLPIPRIATFDNRADAVRQAESWRKEARPSLRWMKIYRADNELYVCWLWENPATMEPTVKEELAPKPAKPIKKKRWWRKK